MSQNGAGKKPEQFQETVYFTLISPETLGKFRHYIILYTNLPRDIREVSSFEAKKGTVEH